MTFHELNFETALTKNLGRDVRTQGERLGVYNGGPDNLCYRALCGYLPAIDNAVTIGTPDEEGNVPFIVRGYGRVRSALEWQRKSPLERVKDALAAQLPASKGGESIKLTPGEIKELKSIDDLPKMTVMLAANRPDDWAEPQAIIDAFSADVEVPLVEFDGTEAEARDAAWADVAIQEATLADKFERFLFLRAQGKRQNVIATDLKVDPSRVSHFRSYANCLDGDQRTITVTGPDGEPENVSVVCSVHDAMDAVIRAHMAGLGKGRSASFDRLGDDKHLGYLGKGKGVSELEQLNLLVSAWQQTNEDAKVHPTPETVDAWSANEQGDKLVQFAGEIDGGILTKLIAEHVSAAAMAELRESDPEAAAAIEAQQNAPDTPQGNAPSVASIRALFSHDRWAEDGANVPHPYSEVFLLVGLFACGHISAEEFLQRSAETKKGRGKYAEGSAKVPSEVADATKYYSEVVKAEQRKAEAEAKRAERERRKAEAQAAKDDSE